MRSRVGVWSLGLFRFLLGMGEAGNWPAGVKVVAEWFPEKERALASGIFNSGSAIGAILAPPVIVWIVLASGWKQAFVFVGASGLLWVALWWMIYRPPAAPLPTAKAAVAGRMFGAWELLRTPFVQRFTVAKIFLDPAWYFYTFWFPEYLRRARGFELQAIGAQAWIPFAVAGLGNLAGGWMAGRLLKAGVPAARTRVIAVWIFASLMTAAIPAVLVDDARWSIALVSVAMMGYTGCTGKPAGGAGRRAAVVGVGVGVWDRQHGRRAGRDDLLAGHRLGGGSLFVRPGVCRFRRDATGGRGHPGKPRRGTVANTDSRITRTQSCLITENFKE